MTFQEILAQLRQAICQQASSPEMASLQKASLMLRKSGILEHRLQTGETAPNFTIDSPDGDSALTLYSLLERGPVILNFFRGSWCKFCLTELQAFMALTETFKQFNTTCLALSPQHPDTYPEDLKLQLYPQGILVHDSDNSIAKLFGVSYSITPEYQQFFTDKALNLAKLHHSEHWELPLAATYLVNQDRSVSFSYAETDFRKRFDPQLLIERLQ